MASTKKTPKTQDKSLNSGSNLRIPPQNIEAEKSVLGSLMLDSNAIIRVADILTANDFYKASHRIIYAVMLELFTKNEPIDVLSTSARLKEKKLLKDVGGTSLLTDLVNEVPTASNIAHYAGLVQKKAVLRNLIDASQHISSLGYQEEDEIETLLDEAEKKIFSISQKSLRQNVIHIKTALEEAWGRIDRLHKNTGELRGVPTGFKELDGLLSGLQESDLIILAARPSVGKTALALDIARHAAVNNNIPVAIFSLEMSVQQLTDRFISAEAHVDLYKLRTGKLSVEGDDFTRIRDSLDSLSKAPIFIDDGSANTILQMRAMARRMQAEQKLGLIIVDYLQLIQPQRPTDSMVQHITEVSRSLKSLAKELNVPVLALAQLSRAVEQRPGSVPRLSDLRDSGSIEQDADVVMFIYREDKYKQNSDRENQADIIIAKHRNGPVGKVTLYFNQNRASFSSMENTAGFVEDF